MTKLIGEMRPTDSGLLTWEVDLDTVPWRRGKHQVASSDHRPTNRHRVNLLHELQLTVSTVAPRVAYRIAA